MKKSIAVLCIVGFVPLFSTGQSCPESFLGSKTLYQSQQLQYIPPPEGYLPVFINHVGRHAARHLTKGVNTTNIYQMLLHIDSLKGLSETGKLLKEKILLLEKVERKNIKFISLLGKTEQTGLAERMFANNSHIFTHAKTIFHISYTKEIRTLQSCEAFLAAINTKIKESVISKQLNDTTLRFYDLSPAFSEYKDNGKWHQYLQQFKDSLKYNDLAVKVARQFFSVSYINKLSSNELNSFTSELFGFVSIFYSIQQEIKDEGLKISDVDMQRFFTCDQLSTLGKIDNAEDYYIKGPGTALNGIQIKIAIPLLADFINTTDQFVNSGKINVQLRFSHAEAIAPIAALMGFASNTTKQVKDINQVWNSDKVIPLSSNIQWILYQKPGSENYLIKFLLNEKEVAIQGLATQSFPYYNWNTVRTFYIKKLESFNAGLNTDFVKYLRELK